MTAIGVFNAKAFNVEEFNAGPAAPAPVQRGKWHPEPLIIAPKAPLDLGEVEAVAYFEAAVRLDMATPLEAEAIGRLTIALDDLGIHHSLVGKAEAVAIVGPGPRLSVGVAELAEEEELVALGVL